MKLRILGTIGLAAALALTACGGGGEESNAEGGADDNAVEVSADENEIAWEETELTAPANADFTVQFENPSALGHNFVLVRQGEEETVASAAGPDGNVPDGTQGVIAASDVIMDAEDEVPVEALEPGTYTYICTVPGHTSLMQGTLTVEE